MTQVELAKKLGLSQSVLSEYERGGRRLHGQLVVQLAHALRVGADDLLGIRTLKENGTQSAAARPFLKRLRYLERLSERQRKALLQTVDAFLVAHAGLPKGRKR